MLDMKGIVSVNFVTFVIDKQDRYKMDIVITRIWHGITQANHAAEYLQYLEKTGVEGYKKTPGNLSVQILRRIEGDKCHFWTVTKWKSYEDIKAFAGEDYEKARYYPEDKNYLLTFEPTVIHCETFEF